jgi:hypothetical protein
MRDLGDHLSVQTRDRGDDGIRAAERGSRVQPRFDQQARMRHRLTGQALMAI